MIGESTQRSPSQSINQSIKQTNRGLTKNSQQNTMAHLLESVCAANLYGGHVEDLTSTVAPEDFEDRVKSPVDLEATVVPEEQSVKIPKKVTIVEADNALRDQVKYLERLVELLVEQRAPGSPEIIDVEVVDFRGKRRMVPAVAERTVVVAKERVVEVAEAPRGYSNLLDSVFEP